MINDKIPFWRWMQIRYWLWQHDRRQTKMQRKAKPQPPDAAGWYALWLVIVLMLCVIAFNIWRAAEAVERDPVIIQGCGKIA